MVQASLPGLELIYLYTDVCPTTVFLSAIRFGPFILLILPTPSQYKLFLQTKGNPIVADEKSFVQQMTEKSETVQDRLHGAAASNLLLKDGWDNQADIYESGRLIYPTVL